MSPAERLLARADYVDPGRPGTWPNGEKPEVRVHYDQMLAAQSGDGKASTR